MLVAASQPHLTLSLLLLLEAGKRHGLPEDTPAGLVDKCSGVLSAAGEIPVV